MSRSVMWTMVLGLIRDRGALVMAFVLPTAFFVIFAFIFAGTGGDSLQMKLAVGDEIRTDVSRRLLASLERSGGVRRVGGSDLTADEVRRMVRSGSADVGLIIPQGAAPLDRIGADGAPPLQIAVDPARDIAVRILKGQIQKSYFEALPDVALRSVVEIIDGQIAPFSTQQKARIDVAMGTLRDSAADGDVDLWRFEDMYERVEVAGAGGGNNAIPYYAGAVAVMFLLFAAANGAISLLDEKDTGILDRIVSGPSGTAVLVYGKFFYLVMQGFIQVLVIFLVACFAFGVDVFERPGLLAATTLVASAAAAGLGLAIVAACSTRQHAQTVSTVLLLIVSAVGGSMVPRFMMPDVLQTIGWATPNAWALEAYSGILWRNEPIEALYLPWGILGAIAVVGVVTAQILARRFRYV